MSSFEKTIKSFLDKRSKEEPAFGEKYTARCQNEKDAVAGCCRYITSEARKKAENGCAVIEDAEVYGWAMHYFDENIQAPKSAPRADVKTSSSPKADDAQKTAVPKPKPKAPKVDECQLSLF